MFRLVIYDAGSMSSPEFSRYRRDLEQLAATGLAAARGGSVVDEATARAVAAAQLLLRNDPDLYGSLVEGFEYLSKVGPGRVQGDGQMSPQAVVDVLSLHLHIRAFNERYEELPPGVWSACEDRLAAVVEGAREIEVYSDVPPPPDFTDMVLWRALCLLDQTEATRRDVDVELIDGIVHQAINQPAAHPAGSGGQSEEKACPERGRDFQPLRGRVGQESEALWTLRDLRGLHALANLALSRRTTAWARRVREIASYHVEHTPPEMTQTQPWALFAFAWAVPGTRFAEEQIRLVRAAGELQGTQIGPLAALLLADAVSAMRAFDATEGTA